MENSSQIRLYSVYIGKSYIYYMILKWLIPLVLLLSIILKFSEILILLIPIVLVFLLVIILHIFLYRSRKKERVICTLSDNQFTIESLEFVKTLDLNLSEIKNITFFLESYLIDIPSRSPDLIPGFNRLVIVKSNNEKINLQFVINSFNEMKELKVKIKRINLIHPNVDYKIVYI